MKQPYITFCIILLSAHGSYSQTIQQGFKVSNIPKSAWIPQGFLALTQCDYHYCSYLCLTNLNKCSAFTINAAGQCEVGTINGYIPLRTDGNAGIKVYIANKVPANAGQAPQQNLTKVPHVQYFSAGNGLYDYSLNSTLSPGLTMPASTPAMLAETWLHNFYREGKIYVCGVSQTCYSAKLGDAAFVVESAQTMLHSRSGGASVDMGNLFWVTGGATTGSSQISSTEYWQNGKWHPGPDLPIIMCCHASVAISTTQVFFVGGYSNTYYTPQTWTYDFSTDLWTSKASYPGNPRTYPAIVTMTLSDGKLYVFIMGGCYGTSCASKSNELGQYDVALNTWTAGPTMLRARNYALAFVMSGNMILLLGGRTAGEVPVYPVDTYIPGQGWTNVNPALVNSGTTSGTLINV